MAAPRQFFLLLGVFIVALIFRIWLTNFVPQPFIADQVEYEGYAQKIYTSPYMLASHSYRTYPAPLLFAIIYKFAGFGSHAVVYVVLAIIDSLTAIFLYLIVKQTTGNKKSGLIASLLYAVNPFTSGNTGALTSEVLSTFFVAASLLSGALFVKKATIGRGILLGICAGLSTQTRPAMTIGLLVIILTVFLWVRWKTVKIALVGVALGGILTILYPLYTNWRDYREFTPFKVDNFYAMEFYNGATLNILPPFTQIYPIQQQVMWGEYWSEYYPGRTTAQRSALAQKYIRLGWDVVKANPWNYIRWRFYKVWYVWQKENIYPYTEPGFQSHRVYTFWGNTILLALALVGLVSGYFTKKQKYAAWIWATCIGVLVSQTVAFCFSHAESRLTLPLYPLVMMLAAFGVTGWRSK